MATYKEIRGTHIVSVTSDPPSPVNGQMWYNSTERVVKGFTSNPVGSWATGGALGTARDQARGTGTLTAGLAFGGATPPVQTKTESYNGTSYSEVNDLNEARRLLGTSGLATLSLAFGGQPSSPPVYSVAKNEEWNGASWVEIADLNVSRIQLVGTGTATSAIAMGGSIPGPTGYQATTEEWSGSTNSTKTIDTD